MNERLAFGAPIDGLLDRLYARNVAQNAALETYFRTRAAEGSLDWNQFVSLAVKDIEALKRFLRKAGVYRFAADQSQKQVKFCLRT